MLRRTFLLFFLVTARARAFDLDWDAPEECPDKRFVETGVARIVGAKEKRRVVVRAKARTDARAWTIDLTTHTGDEDGERTLRGATCAEVAEAAVLVIALTIDPEVMSASAPQPPPPSPPPPPPLPPPPPRPAPRPRSLFGSARLSGGASFGVPPGAAPMIELAGGVRSGLFAAHVGAIVAFESSTSLAGASGAFWLFGAFARACLSPSISVLGALLCAGMEVDLFEGRGYGITSPRKADVWWAAPRIDLEPSVRLNPSLRVVLPMTLAIPLDQRAFSIGGVGRVFEPPPALGRVSLGLEWVF